MEDFLVPNLIKGSNLLCKSDLVCGKHGHVSWACGVLVQFTEKSDDLALWNAIIEGCGGNGGYESAELITLHSSVWFKQWDPEDFHFSMEVTRSVQKNL